MDETARRIRVIDLETGGNGPDEVCEIGWQDLVEGGDGVWRLGERGAALVNPGRPMSPETMAVHHILDEEVAEAPFWKEVAPQVLRSPGLVALAAHRAAFEQRYCRPKATGGVGWICTWKCALRLWPDLPRFSNQMLWTNGKVRINRVIDEASVKRFHYAAHEQLRHRLPEYTTAYNFGQRLTTLKGLTPNAFIC